MASKNLFKSYEKKVVKWVNEALNRCYGKASGMLSGVEAWCDVM